MTRVLVTGGRGYGQVPRYLTRYTPAWNNARARAAAEEAQLILTLDEIHGKRGISVIIHGAASGADSLAKAWAKRNGIPDEPYKANWYPDGFGKLDRSAGPRRNQTMITRGKPDFVVAFPGGDGTADCVRRARSAEIEVIEVPPCR